MQINAGKAKGHKLRAVPGDTTRPVTDMVKQAVFNILQNEVQDTAWLDLFGGTGAIGIEALSRGAAHVTFVDKERLAVETILLNLRSTKLEAFGKVIRQDSFIYLGGHPNQQYDFVYIAPPQYLGLWSKAVKLIDAMPSWLKAGGEVVVQIDPKEFEILDLKHLELTEQRKYGKTLLCFYEQKTTDQN